jgi:hypothetical protein
MILDSRLVGFVIVPYFILYGAGNALMCPFLGPVMIERFSKDCNCKVELDETDYTLKVYPKDTEGYSRNHIMSIVDRVGYDTTMFTLKWSNTDQ